MKINYNTKTLNGEKRFRFPCTSAINNFINSIHCISTLKKTATKLPQKYTPVKLKNETIKASGEEAITMYVSWTTIKEIYNKIVEHFEKGKE